jgi:hypothetical protein
MSKTIQLRRGTTISHQTFAGAAGEITVDTDKWTVVVHDGTTIGGFPLKVEAQEYVRTRYLTFRAVLTQRGVPSLGFSAPENAPIPMAIQESSGIITGAAVFQRDIGQSIQDHFMLPIDWVAPVDLEILWRTNTIIGTATWQVETCGVPIGQTIESASFNPPQIVFAEAGIGQPYQLVTTTISGLDTTGFAPEGEVFIRFTRLPHDALAADAELISLRFVIRIKGK